jgi:hypothetical protein
MHGELTVNLSVDLFDHLLRQELIDAAHWDRPIADDRPDLIHHTFLLVSELVLVHERHRSVRICLRALVRDQIDLEVKRWSAAISGSTDVSKSCTHSSTPFGTRARTFLSESTASPVIEDAVGVRHRPWRGPGWMSPARPG